MRAVLKVFLFKIYRKKWREKWKNRGMQVEYQNKNSQPGPRTGPTKQS